MEFESINRAAVVLGMKKPFVDWINSGQKGKPYFDPNTQKNDNKSIYLVPDDIEEDEIEDYIESQYEAIFAEQLSIWYEDEKLWPKNRTFSMFKEWFDYGTHSLVLDTCEHTIEHNAVE